MHANKPNLMNITVTFRSKRLVAVTTAKRYLQLRGTKGGWDVSENGDSLATFLRLEDAIDWSKRRLAKYL